MPQVKIKVKDLKTGLIHSLSAYGETREVARSNAYKRAVILLDSDRLKILDTQAETKPY